MADFTDDQYKAYLRRIGNLTLLGKRLNSKVANLGFVDKKTEYAKSQIPMTLDLLTHVEWKIGEIEKRQLAKARLAVKAWPAKPR